MPGTDIRHLAARRTVLRVALPVPLPRLFDYLPVGDHAGCDGRRAASACPFGTRELIGVVADDRPGRRPSPANCGRSDRIAGRHAAAGRRTARFAALAGALHARAAGRDRSRPRCRRRCAAASRCPTPNLGLAARPKPAHTARAGAAQRQPPAAPAPICWPPARCAEDALDERDRRLARGGARAGRARPGRTGAPRATRSAAVRRRRARSPTPNRRRRIAVDRRQRTTGFARAAARRRHRQRQDRGLPAGDRRLPGARAAGAGAGAGDRTDAADAGALPRAARRAPCMRCIRA